jgi:hypothetical protein
MVSSTNVEEFILSVMADTCGPYQYAHNASVKGYWSTNLESVHKDVECTFWIMKKRWRILEYGIHYRCIETSEKIFVVC